MIKLPDHITPSQRTLDKLREYQNEIDRLVTFEEKSEKAKAMFKNSTSNRAFDEVKEKLTAMCSGARRCRE